MEVIAKLDEVFDDFMVRFHATSTRTPIRGDACKAHLNLILRFTDEVDPSTGATRKVGWCRWCPGTKAWALASGTIKYSNAMKHARKAHPTHFRELGLPEPTSATKVLSPASSSTARLEVLHAAFRFCFPYLLTHTHDQRFILSLFVRCLSRHVIGWWA
jgi:hypothetical protein